MLKRVETWDSRASTIPTGAARRFRVDPCEIWRGPADRTRAQRSFRRRCGFGRGDHGQLAILRPDRAQRRAPAEAPPSAAFRQVRPAVGSSGGFWIEFASASSGAAGGGATAAQAGYGAARTQQQGGSRIVRPGWPVRRTRRRRRGWCRRRAGRRCGSPPTLVNNTLLIYASQEQYGIIEQTVRQI